MMGEPAACVWDWPDSNVRRRRNSVADLILWSYAGLIITRRVMDHGDRFAPRGRPIATQRVFGQLTRANLRPRSLEQEDRGKLLHHPCCAHCGDLKPATLDHLIPRAKGGQDLGFNLVPSCKFCNSSRGAQDLCAWYRKRQMFPTLQLMRHYLKLCLHQAGQMGLADQPVPLALAEGLPFDPVMLPTKYPPVDVCLKAWPRRL